jgi:hypothetical protein
MHLPNTNVYWSKGIFGAKCIFDIMKRDTFDKISQYFHTADTTQNPPRGHARHDKLYHVRQVLNIIKEKCMSMYNPHQNVSIDEAMIAFRGRLGFKQYMPAKPTKYGIKVWMRGDPTNGYTNDFQVYTGKEAGVREVGLGTRVIRDMVRGIENKYHIVNCDNYFMSPEVCDVLLAINTYVRGTMRMNRKNYPGATLHKKCVKNQGDMKILQKGELVAAAWKDKRVVHFLSTAENPANIRDTVARKQRDGTVVQVPAPSIVRLYNDHMNGVDTADQIRTQLPTYRQSKKWWLYMFWFLFDLAIANAFIVMRESPTHQRQSRRGGGESQNDA